MSYIYTPHEWHNDAPPAINEKNLNEIEAGLVRVFKALNEEVAMKYELSDNNFTNSYKDMLDEIETEQPRQKTEGERDKLITSGAVYNKLSYVDNKVINIETQIEKAKRGESDTFSKVATTGSYNDLKDKLKPDNKTVFIDATNTISAVGSGGGSKIPVQSNIPVQETGEIWFRTFEEN